MSTEEKSGLVGQVLNIQRYSTHDGPGIRTTVFLKGCPLTCFWCQNPESQSLKPVLLFRDDRCTLCGRCIKACPTGANSIIDGKLVINRELCTSCGACVKACLDPDIRKIEGKKMTVEQVMAEVLKDYRLYCNSGGGITVSGGDCEMQPEFTVALLTASREEGVNTCVEISGAFPWEIVKSITDLSDYIFYDLKHMDDSKHKEGTGVSNEYVLENAKKLSKENKDMFFRVPLIPGYNDDKENIEATVRFIRDELGLNPAECVELLPYNNLGEDKYTRIGTPEKQPSYKRQSVEYIKELNDIIAAG